MEKEDSFVVRVNPLPGKGIILIFDSYLSVMVFNGGKESFILYYNIVSMYRRWHISSP